MTTEQIENIMKNGSLDDIKVMIHVLAKKMPYKQFKILFTDYIGRLSMRTEAYGFRLHGDFYIAVKGRIFLVNCAHGWSEENIETIIV